MSTASPALRIPGLGRESMAELRSQARRKGLTPERYVRELLEEHLEREHAARTQTFDELFKPVRTRARGTDEGELDELVQRIRRQQPRQRGRQKSL